MLAMLSVISEENDLSRAVLSPMMTMMMMWKWNCFHSENAAMTWRNDDNDVAVCPAVDEVYLAL